ncbi:type II toxin-antitoxin system VapC family toxin [Patescibacteria group bacterium]|nr:type II toxin-antitoxin system VapC family toxin [Patescibacteria group bacterium]
MILLDTNIFIYLAKGELAADSIANTDIAHASITKVEALGFPALPANELLLLTELFEESYTLDLSAAIVNQAIRLRQAKPMSLGDAIIAATALEHNLELWTANTEDFIHIEKLQLVNPMS